ncbi:diguanylate cyclase (GGDEF) domain-containing protein [Nocardioides terrae]|uniref:Diguanylate cyclase (GGDEF) domain-containing protein n=1 Tax=Nocardioides terrae TaxID=574651 RepID=A0A1I1L5U7_9ACTN|nr:EAL domain-containing protein [Nocardioides terrae]SFC68427.1 diguanylate cyclase (GGDEF) domain-containing protein [Nocardioides terrae]
MSRTAVAHTAAARLSLVVLIGGWTANQIATTASYRTGQAILLTTLTAFFLLLMLRLALAAALYRGRRLPLLVLLITVATWSLGSMTVNAASLEEQTHFPAPGEWLFLVSYLGLAGYLMIDVERRQGSQARGWLDVAVICGVSSCLASLLLVTPIRLASGAEGLALLLALMYPLADLALALVVLGQHLLQARTDSRRTLMMGAAFVLLAGGDSGFALQVSAPTYDFGNTSNALWGAGWALLVAAACRPEQRVMRAIPKAAGTRLLVPAGALALAVLTIRPDDALAFYTVPPAVLTLAAVGARMVLALRDANRAAEAFALSQTDDLTNLPNRRAVRARLMESLSDRRPLALMLLDLDGFKEINDTLGHHAGDSVLKFVGFRMQQALGSEAMVARLGGDEFAILLETVDQIELVETAHRVLHALAEPLVVDGIEIGPGGSIGITVVEDADTDSGEVLRRADVAMYQAKSSRSGAAVYDAHLDEFSRSRLELAEELRKGIAEGQIEVWYQPQLDARTMRVSALEALVRWRHPLQGVLSPVAFLPAARRAGLMGLLSDDIAWHAVRDLQRLLAAGLDLRVAINCAPPELLSQSFLPRLYAALQEWDVPPDRLVLEVTEDSFLADPERARDVLLELRDRGIQVSIDDYGTGFSSLAYLRNLPVQELKIDRSLVRDVPTDDRSRLIVSSTIQLAHALDMRTVAEGVEDATNLAQLAAMGVDIIQGYQVARPMPAAAVERWMQEWTDTETAAEDAAENRRSG